MTGIPSIGVGLRQDQRSHPIAQLQDQGVKVTISIGDSRLSARTMDYGYDRVAEALGSNSAVVRTIAATALDAASGDADTKARIGTLLEPTDG